MDEQLELLRGIASKLGLTPVASGITVLRIFRLYKITRPRGRPWQMERNLLRPFVVAHWRCVASSLGAADWIAHRGRRRKQKTRLGRAPCDLTLNLELKAITRMFRWAVRAKHILERPFLDVRPVKTRTRRESWFTEPQIAQLIGGADGLRWRHQRLAFRAVVAAMACTGLRISEALSLRWDRITLRGTTSVLGKGSKTRVVAFTPEALDLMNRLDRHQWNPLVFCNWKSGKNYNASTIRAWFRKAIEFAHLEGVKADGDLALVPHVLRHSFASIAEERGARAELIQAALGHSSPATTRVYLHRSEQDAAIRMAAIMGKRQAPKRAPKLTEQWELENPVGNKEHKKVLRS